MILTESLQTIKYFNENCWNYLTFLYEYIIMENLHTDLSVGIKYNQNYQFWKLGSNVAGYQSFIF